MSGALECLRRAVPAARRRRAYGRLEALIEAEQALDEAVAVPVRDARREELSWTSIGEASG